MKQKKKVGLIILVANLFLVLIKGTVWYLTGSTAVQSETFNSMVDLTYSTIIISGFMISSREKTSEYPEGLIRLEPLISLVVSGIIIITGLYISYEGIQILVFGNTETERTSLAIGVLLISSLIKVGLYKYISRKAQKFNSPSLAATAVDTKNDILTAVIALTGVSAIMVGIPEAEGVAAVIVSGYITYSGAKVAEENIEYALGKSVDEEIEEKIKEAAMKNDEVKGTHDVEIHHTGPLIDVSMHIEIDGDIKVEKGHEIELDVADKIRDSCDEEINEINIHLDPKTIGEWKN